VVSYFSTNDSSGTWLVDSGCPHHLCKDVDIFKRMDVTHNSRVKVENDIFLDVKEKSLFFVSTTSRTKVVLDVLYILDISQNLLSIG